MLVRRLSTGFIAGACSLAGVLLILLLVLLGGNLFNLLHELSINQTIKIHGDITFWDTIGQAFTQSLGALPGYFWSARWGMLALGLLGIVLAGVDVLRSRVDRPWRDSLGFVVTLGVVGAIVIAFQYANQESLQAWLTDQPGLINQQAAFIVSDMTMLLTGIIITLGLGYIIWAAWHWWFERLARWLRLSRPVLIADVASAQPAVPSDDWRSYQDRLMRLKRSQNGESEALAAPAQVRRRSLLWIIAPALLVATLLVYGALQWYHAFDSNIITGQSWVSSDEPATAIPLAFKGIPRQINISNINGEGSIAAYLTTTADSAPQRQVTLQLPGLTNDYATAHLDVAGLAAGNYLLNIVLQNGKGGPMLYAALEGGGAGAIYASLALGLVAGIWIALLIILGYEVLASRSSRI